MENYSNQGNKKKKIKFEAPLNTKVYIRCQRDMKHMC